MANCCGVCSTIPTTIASRQSVTRNVDVFLRVFLRCMLLKTLLYVVCCAVRRLGAQVIGMGIERSSSYAVCCTNAVCCMPFLRCMLYAACCLHEPAGDVTGAHFSKRKDQTAGGVTGAQVIGVRIERSSSYAVCCTYAVCCMLHAVFIKPQGTLQVHTS